MTETFSPLTIAAALAAAKTFTGPYDLVGVTPKQRILTYAIPAHTRALASYAGSSLGIASFTATAINTELARHGAGIRLDPWPKGARSLGIAGVTDITVNWPEPAELAPIEAKNGARYAGFALSPAQTTHVVRVPGYRGPIVQAQTLAGLDLRIAMMAQPRSQFDLMRAALTLHRTRIDLNNLVGHTAHVPMVKLDEQPDISWLVGFNLRVENGPAWEVVQARQVVRFGMNQFGPLAKKAGGGADTTTADNDKPYVINGPFLITIGDRGNVPLFGAYITPDSWIDPGLPTF